MSLRAPVIISANDCFNGISQSNPDEAWHLMSIVAHFLPGVYIQLPVHCVLSLIIIEMSSKNDWNQMNSI